MVFICVDQMTGLSYGSEIHIKEVLQFHFKVRNIVVFSTFKILCSKIKSKHTHKNTKFYVATTSV
jgi:hypothetical protein